MQNLISHYVYLDRINLNEVLFWKFLLLVINFVLVEQVLDDFRLDAFCTYNPLSDLVKL